MSGDARRVRWGGVGIGMNTNLETVQDTPGIEQDAFARILVGPRENIVGSGAHGV